MGSPIDTIFATSQNSIGPFVFDDSVAEVFDDMIRRSVPGYETIIHMAGVLAGQYALSNSQCYDLGCSLGATTMSMRHRIKQPGCRIIAVDNSSAMLDRCRHYVSRQTSNVPVEYICQDIQNIKFVKASMVILNYTLQFIRLERRRPLLKKIYEGMLPGSVLVISEKIAFADPQEEHRQVELHHAFKRMNGYSDLEISRKRTALEHVLVPDTLDKHRDRLASVGFKEVHVWFQCLNFASMIAFKK